MTYINSMERCVIHFGMITFYNLFLKLKQYRASVSENRKVFNYHILSVFSS